MLPMPVNHWLKNLFSRKQRPSRTRRDSIRPLLECLENPVTPATHLSIEATDAIKLEGNAGTTPFTFTVTRNGQQIDTSAHYAVTGSGANPANAADFGGTFPSGTVRFTAGGPDIQVITINVSGDTTVEPGEGFTVRLDSPTNGADFLVDSA